MTKIRCPLCFKDGCVDIKKHTETIHNRLAKTQKMEKELVESRNIFFNEYQEIRQKLRFVRLTIERYQKALGIKLPWKE